MDFGGDGVVTEDFSEEGLGYVHFVKWYYINNYYNAPESDLSVEFPSGPLSRNNFPYIGNNTYKGEDDKGNQTISFPDSSTIVFEEYWSGSSDVYQDHITVTVKRVN